MRSALDSVQYGATDSHLVAAADQRPAYPKSVEEQIFGDAAAAALIGSKDSVATIEGQCAINNEMMDVWRKPEDRHVRMFDAKEAYEMGLLNKIVPPEELQKEFMELARTFPRVRREPML